MPKTKAKHTPGPWTANKRGGKWHIDSLVTFAYDGRNADGLSLTEAEREANARLIAAAPELLEAAKEMLRWDPDGETPLCQPFEKLKKAIAKAEGR